MPGFNTPFILDKVETVQTSSMVSFFIYNSVVDLPDPHTL